VMEQALELIATGHLGDDRVGRLSLALSRLPLPGRESFLRGIVRESKSPLVPGRACLALAQRTVYILDDKGVIRVKNSHDESLDRFIDGLLKEASDVTGAVQTK